MSGGSRHPEQFSAGNLELCDLTQAALSKSAPAENHIGDGDASPEERASVASVMQIILECILQHVEW